MLKLAKTIIQSQIKTQSHSASQENIIQIGEKLAQTIQRQFARALAIRMVDAGSCNACELEIQATQYPHYNLAQFGIQFVASPRHADMLLVTGPVTLNMRDALLSAYKVMPQPKWVVAVGDCAHTCGVFKNSYAIAGSVNDVIPVNCIVKGCPPTPVDIMSGILSLFT